MAMIDQPKEQGKVQEAQNKVQFRIIPSVYSSIDSKMGEIRMEIHLPGVKKENIRIKVLPDLFDLHAKRDENSYYGLTEYFPYELKADTITAQYENGLLEVKGKIKDPMEQAVTIKVE